MDQRESRRRFVKQSISVTGGIFLIASGFQVIGCEQTTYKNNPISPNGTDGLTINGMQITIDVNSLKFETLASTGGYVTLDVLGSRVFIIRLSDSSASTISRVCTHLGCDISPASKGLLQADRLVCPCHGSTFLVKDGSRVSGPAPNGVQSYPTSIAGNIISVDLS